MMYLTNTPLIIHFKIYVDNFYDFSKIGFSGKYSHWGVLGKFAFWPMSLPKDTICPHTYVTFLLMKYDRVVETKQVSTL